jgi:WD40 repeat protein
VVDPYDWLEVPKGLRPPNHYQLLGLDPSVADPAAVRAAADRQLRRLLPHLTGPDALAAEQVWSELEDARDTLLDTGRRDQYDATLPPREVAAPPPSPAAAPDPYPPDISAFEEPPTRSAPSSDQPWWKACPEAAPTAGGAWWKQPLPDEPAASPPTATATQAAAATQVAVAVPPPAASRPDPIVPDTIAPPRRGRRQTSKLAVGAVALLMAAAIGGGMYYAFGRKHSTEPSKTEPAHDLTKTDPKPKPIDPGPAKPTDEPLVAAVSLPKDFADQLRPRTFAGHSGAVNWIAVDRSGSRFATAGTDRTIRLWAVTRDGGLVRHTFPSPAVGAAWDATARLFAADGHTLGVFDLHKMAPPRGFDSPRGGVTALAVSPNGDRAITGLTDGYLRLWDVTAGRSEEWPVAARGAITAVDVSADGKRALGAAEDGTVSLWEISSRNRILDWSPHPGGTTAVQFSPDGTRAATAGADGSASVYDLASRKEVCRLTGHTGPVTGIAWQPSGRQVVTVGVDGTARLWNAATGQPVRWVQPLDGKGVCVAVDPGDRYALAGTSTGVVHLFPLPRVKGEDLAGPPAKPPADPLPVPTPEAVTAALVPIRTELKKEYGYNRPDDLSVLADNLRRRASAERVAPALRYGLLQEARTLAIKAADPVTAVRAVEDRSLWFDVDELAEKAATLAALSPDADSLAVVSAGLVAAERAETDARPEVVDRVLKRLGDVTGLPAELADRLAVLRKRAAASATERKGVRQAMDILKNASDHPESNQTVGLYLCLGRQDWVAGLPHVAKGTDPRLIDAAKADLATPTDPKAQHRLGELWYAFALEARDHRAKRAYLGRARYWFERELKAKLEVTDAVKARARLDDVARLDVPGNDPATLPLLSPVIVRRAYNTVGEDVTATEWRLDGGATPRPDGVALPPGTPALQSKFGLAPSGRLSLVFRSDGRQVRFNLAGQEVAFAAPGPTLRVTIERKDDAVTLTAFADEGEPVSRTIDLPPAARGPATVAVRLTGTATRPDGAQLTAAIARGSVSLPPVTPE